MSRERMPPAEVEVDAALVRGLLADQFPRWAELPLRPLEAIGWDNVIYRLGDELVVRLPRRQLVADLVENEHRWLPILAPRLPVPIPVPIGKGQPGLGYPWRWSVCPWIPGEMAAVARLSDDEMVALARDLGRFVAAMNTPGPPDAPRHAWRGVPLVDRDAQTRGSIDVLRGEIDAAAVEAAWERAVAAPRWNKPDAWLHGDLHPGNLIVERGRLSGVIDFVDLMVGDPAADLVSGWMLFPPPARMVFRDATGVDDATWDRGRGWALSIGLACLAHSADNHVVGAIGRRGIDAVLADQV